MKIQRRDLVDQFEDVVKQEIANNQKCIESTNTALRSFQHNLDQLECSLDHAQAQIHDKHLQIERNVSKQESDFIHTKSQMMSKMNDMEAEIEELNKRLDAEIDKIKMQSVEIDTLHKSDNILNSAVKAIKHKIESMMFYFDQMIDNTKKHASYEAARVKKDIQEIPDPVAPLKDDVMKKFKELQVNREEILREIRVYKKQIFVQEKEIEDLYSRLEKLARG